MHVCVETGLCVCECVWRLGCVCVVMHMWRDAVSSFYKAFLDL